MKKRNLTSLFAALVLTVVASSSLLCGNAIVSYEDVTDAPRGIEIYVDPPEHGKVKHYAMIEYSWTGDSQATYMQVGYTQNPTHGGYTEIQKQNGELKYREFRVPSDNLSSTGMEYLWAKTVYVSNGTPYYSESRVYTQGLSLDHPITGSITTGNLTAAGQKDYYTFSGARWIYISAAYKDNFHEFKVPYTTGTLTGSFTLAGTVIHYQIEQNSIEFSTNSGVTIPCDSTSNLITNCLAIGYSVQPLV